MSYMFEDTTPKPVLTFSNANNESTIVMCCRGNEMLKISSEGFWVRGQLVKQDDKEAQAVYNSFKQWLIMSTLTQP